jgi:hypothetical protein
MEQELVGGRGRERLGVGEDPDHRQRHVDEQRPAGEEVGRREQVLEPQPQRHPRAEDRRDPAQAAAGPALLLGDVGGHVLGAEPAGEDLGDVGAFPSLLVHPHRELEVLGQRVLGEAIHLLERLAAEDDVGAAAEGGVDSVLAPGDRAEEEVLLGGGGRRDRGLIGVGVVLRRLDESDARLLEVAEGGGEEVGAGDVVAVEDGDVGGVGDAEGVVEVAGLGALVLLPGDVARAMLPRNLRHLGAVAVVAEPHPPRPLHPPRGLYRRLDHVNWLVVDRDQHIDCSVPVRGGALGAEPLIGAGPPEADRLGEVEGLGGDQDPVQQRCPDPLALEEPVQVPGGEQGAEHRHHEGAPPGGALAGHRPPDRPEPGIAAAHPNSQIRIWALCSLE